MDISQARRSQHFTLHLFKSKKLIKNFIILLAAFNIFGSQVWGMMRHDEA
jgi:hypothetical protein